MSLSVLRKHIEQDKLSGAFLFYGSEKFLIRYFLDIITKKVVEPGTEQMNLIRFEDSKDISSIIACCETYPVFAEKKLVLVKNTGMFAAAKKGSNTENEENQNAKDVGGAKEELIEFLKDVPDYCCLIFIEEGAAKNVKAYKEIATSGLVVEFERLSDPDLEKWIARVFADNGKKVSRDAVALMIKLCSNSMDEIYNEIQKICNLVGTRIEISQKDVAVITGTTIKTAIFDITNAFAQKNANKAFGVLEDLTQLNEPIQRLFIMVSKRFGQYLLLKELLGANKGEDSAMLAAGFGLNQKRYVLAEVRAFSVKYLREFVKECNNLDLDIKNGRLADRLAVELLISKFCTK